VIKKVRKIRQIYLLIGLLMFSSCILQTACFLERSSNTLPENKTSETPKTEESSANANTLSSNPIIEQLPSSPETVTFSLIRNRKNKIETVDSETVFVKDDGVRLNISVVEKGFLYIIYKGSGGGIRILFPGKEYNGGKNEVEANQVITIPNKGWFFFDEKAGVETVYVIYSETKDNVIDKDENGKELSTKNKPTEIVELLDKVRGDDSTNAFATSSGSLVRVISLQHE